MAQATVIRIGQERFRLAATIDEGRSLYFTAGSTIAVEKFDMRIGKSEFDFQVTSRRVRGGKPEAIASTQDAMDREFLENRVKSNLRGMPISIGNVVGMAREGRMQLTYGEVRPQVFRSGVGTPVAWRIWFKRTWYSGLASGRGRAPKPTDGRNARASANGSAQIGGVSQPADPGVADGAIGPLTNAAGMLRIYVAEGDPYQPVGRFDRGDVIFRQRTLTERIGSFVRGRGW